MCIPTSLACATSPLAHLRGGDEDKLNHRAVSGDVCQSTAPPGSPNDQILPRKMSYFLGRSGRVTGRGYFDAIEDSETTTHCGELGSSGTGHISH